jgi:hypothetical protein
MLHAPQKTPAHAVGNREIFGTRFGRDETAKGPPAAHIGRRYAVGQQPFAYHRVPHLQKL